MLFAVIEMRHLEESMKVCKILQLEQHAWQSLQRYSIQGDIFCALAAGATLVVAPRLRLLHDFREVGQRKVRPVRISQNPVI